MFGMYEYKILHTLSLQRRFRLGSRQTGQRKAAIGTLIPRGPLISTSGSSASIFLGPHPYRLHIAALSQAETGPAAELQCLN